jgi:hypothetical protein
VATYSSRSRIIGFTDSARLAGIHVANSPSSAIAPPASEQHGFGEQTAHDAMATGAESEAQGNFTGTVSSARGKQAAQVGARGQQN